MNKDISLLDVDILFFVRIASR